MGYSLSAGIWNEGQAYADGGKIKKLSRTVSDDGTLTLRAHVKSAFGFVHHPVVKFDRERNAVTAFSCDCWGAANGTSVCAHCAALLANEGEDKDISVIATPEDNQKLTRESKPASGSAGEPAARPDAVKILSDSVADSGKRTVKGRVTCDFGFVHYPILTLVGGEVADYHCDCYFLAESPKLCPHCQQLLGVLRQEEETVPAPEEDGEMTIDFSALPEEPLPTFDAELPSEEIEAGEPEAEEAELLQAELDEKDDQYLRLQAEFENFRKCIEQEKADCYSSTYSDALKSFQPLLDSLTKAQLESPEDEGIRALVKQRDAILAKLGLEAPEEEGGALPEPDAPAVPPQEELPADFKPESMRILLGHDRYNGKPVYWHPNDTEQLVHVNTGIIGTMGTGKTQFTKSLVTQLIRQQSHNFDGTGLGILIFDYKGDYNLSKADFVRAADAMVLGLHHLPYNPLSLKGLKRKPQLPYHVASAFANILTKIYHLGPVQYNTLLHCIITAYERRGITSDPATWDKEAPTFEQVYQIYSATDAKQDALFSAMYALHQFEIFEPDPALTTSLYALLNGVVVLDLSGYDSRIQNLAVAITLEMFCAQMLNSGSSRWNAKYRQLTKFILVDEADNIMSEGFPALKTILKEGREFGVGTILSTQSLKHFGNGDEEYAGYILTWIVHTVPDLKKSDAEFIFKTNGVGLDRVTQEIALQKKHESVSKLGNADPVFLADLPFWQIVDDAEQSYLVAEEPDPEPAADPEPTVEAEPEVPSEPAVEAEPEEPIS